MAVSAQRTIKRETLNLRVEPETRAIIDRAARMLGKSRAEFILEAAQYAAEEAILHSTLIVLTPEAYAEFVARLNKPPRANARLRKALRTPAPWE